MSIWLDDLFRESSVHNLKMRLTLLLIILGTQTSVTQKAAPELADIVFLIDNSDALGRRDFSSVKAFVNRIINSLPIGPNKYRVALVQYSDDVHVEFQLDDYRARSPMLNHLKKHFLFRGGSLKTGNAMQKVHETFFKTPRKDRNQIVVLATSGVSEDDMEKPAQRLQADGIKIIALGLKDASQQELQSVATHSFYYYFDTPRDLVTFSPNMSAVIEAAVQMDSSVVISTPAPPTVTESTHSESTKVCLEDSVADVAFLVDESVSHENAKHITAFLQGTVNSLDVHEECIRIGLVTYSTEPQVISLLNSETDRSDILKKIQRFSPREGKSNLGAAINNASKIVFAKSTGSRRTQGVEQVATIITHRPADDDVSDAATLLGKAGVTVFAIGIEGANVTQLAQIVSHPPERNIIKTVSFSDLQSQTTTFQKKLFNVIQNKLYVESKTRQQLKTGCKDTEKADIYFLIDGSSSIHRDDFKDMKMFLMEVIKLFTVGPDAVQFGVVQFSTNNNIEFELDDYPKRSSLEKAINNIGQLTGDTYTGAALKVMQPLFEKARKQQKGKVPCHLIVLTDGEAHDDVKVPSEMLRNAEVNIYAIGVGKANKTQLLEIAGSQSRVHFVQQFNALKDIKNDVVRGICSEEACKEMKADFMFLVDSSGSIGFENFEKMKNFTRQLVEKSDIGLDQVHIGVVQFSGTNKEEFPLDRYSTKTDIIDAIGRMSLIGENTLTGGALQFVSDYFKPAKGARPSVNKILILITDGEAQDEVKTPAENLRKDGIIIYSVGVFNANKTQLEEISGKPERVFYVENFDILEQIEGNIIFGICSPPEICKRIERLDVIFVIDSSGSIGETNYGIMKDFMIGLVNKSEVGEDRVQFGAVKYSDDPETLFYLNAYNTKPAIVGAIQSDTLLKDRTYTAKALRHTESLFAEEHGSRIRRNVPQVLIVITDGESHDSTELDEVSKRLRARGIIIYAIGIEGAKTQELQTMAGSKDYWFYVGQFDGLKNISLQLSDYLCNASKPACEIQADLVFLIDSSRSVPRDDFTKMKDFLKGLLARIGYSSNIQIGMGQFSDKYQEEFRLGDYQSESELTDKITNVSMIYGKKTYIGAALKGVQTFFKSPRHRVARNVQQMLLVITDGKSDDPIAEPAEDLRKEGVKIYAIGVGEADDIQLQQITGSADRKYTIDEFGELPNITVNLVRDICGDDGDIIEATCFVDVVMGFDISSMKPGDYLFHGHHLLNTSLPDIIKEFTSLSTVSCSKGTKTQFSVAIPLHSIDQSFQVDHEKVLKELKKVVISSPSRLDVKFLDALWTTFQKQPQNQNRKKVLLIFSDGLDDDVKALEQKSDELRKKGLDGLITVVLEGATNFDDLLYIEFGKGFGYNTQLTIGMQNIASRLFEYVDQIAEKTCCCVFCKCVGEEGPVGSVGKIGPKGFTGSRGSPGYLGEDGEPGPQGDRGPQGKEGHMGCQGSQGRKGERGQRGEKGEHGIDGVDGINGEEGSRGHPGLKGGKGDPGQLGSSGPRGFPGDPGQRGFQGEPGNLGVEGKKGEHGLHGKPGNRGERGSKGFAGSPSSPGNRGPTGQRGPRGPAGLKGIPGPDGFQGVQGFQGPQGTAGIPGVKGQKGYSGNNGWQGNLGMAGPKGDPGKPGPTGNKGEAGDPGDRGERGPRGQRGMRGEEGNPGYGRPGIKGLKGQNGFPGDNGIQGNPGDTGVTGERGSKGNRGIMGHAGERGAKGGPGDWGRPGRPGAKGAKGLPLFSSCELIQYVREHSSCWKGKPECPVYPTELVFALDASEDTTPQIFERMREIVIAIVNNTKIRESNCPVGARVAIVSYNSNTHHLIRFSDFHSKTKLLQELKALSYQRSSSERDIGGAMRFVARNIFKRTLQGANVRKVAVFFSNGQSDNSVSINTAVLEFRALDILPTVIAFKDIPEVNRAFAMDDSGLFQVFNVHQERDYSPALKRFQLCILCYDKCEPDESCLHARTSPHTTYIDAAFILESSRNINPVEFEKLKDFVSTALDNFDISTDPKTSLIGDRVAMVSHAPLDFRPQTQKSPVRTEFDLLTHSSSWRMKRHIQESVQQLSGSAAVGHAIQWTINNIFLEAPNQRKRKAIFVISAGETSQWDKEVLHNAALRAKCQGYALFVLSLGHEYADIQLEELASLPLEHHMVQLGRTHKAELGYVVKFLKPFLQFLRNEINRYPPAQLRRTCAEISPQTPVYVPQSQRHIFAVDGSRSNGVRSLEPAFLDYLSSDSVSSENAISKPQQTVELGN